MLPNSAFNEAVLEPTLVRATFSKHQRCSMMVWWWWLLAFKVKPGNSDTNFNRLGLLSPKTDSTYDAYSVEYSSHSLSSMAQQLSPNAQLLVAGDGNGRPIKNLLMGQFQQWHATACICTSLSPQHMHIQGWQGWYLVAYTMFMVWKWKWRYFSGPFYELSIMKFYSCIACLVVS